MKNLLELRKAMNRARPKFLRTHYGALKKLAKKWQRPTGIHNKLRHKIHGRPQSVNVGYRNPAEVRGLDSQGLRPVLVHNARDIEYLNAKMHTAIIAKTGDKNRISILTALNEKGIKTMNCKDIEGTIKTIQEEYKQKISEAKKTREKRTTAAKEREIIKPKQAPKTPKIAETGAETTKTELEIKKEAEKKELDKVLTQKSE